MQHKWNNISISHIVAGMFYSSKKFGKLEQMVHIMELYNYHYLIIKMSKVYSFRNLKKQECETYYINNFAFPLVTKNILRDNSAVFSGYTNDDLYGKVEIRNIKYLGIPVSILIDNKIGHLMIELLLQQDF